jgi:hypothetical protein
VIILAILNRILDNFGVKIEVLKNQGMDGVVKIVINFMQTSFN